MDQIPVYEKKCLDIHPSLVKPVMVAGAEREMTICFAFSSLIIWMVGKDLVSLLLAIGVWSIGMLLAKFAASKDDRMIKVFIRHLIYKDFYPASELLDEIK